MIQTLSFKVCERSEIYAVCKLISYIHSFLDAGGRHPNLGSWMEHNSSLMIKVGVIIIIFASVSWAQLLQDDTKRAEEPYTWNELHYRRQLPIFLMGSTHACSSVWREHCLYLSIPLTIQRSLRRLCR